MFVILKNDFIIASLLKNKLYNNVQIKKQE